MIYWFNIFIQIYPLQDIQELVRCYSCQKWFMRTCVNISEIAYKQLVQEQTSCAWCCDNCINTKGIYRIHDQIMFSQASLRLSPEWFVRSIFKLLKYIVGCFISLKVVMAMMPKHADNNNQVTNQTTPPNATESLGKSDEKRKRKKSTKAPSKKSK